MQVLRRPFELAAVTGEVTVQGRKRCSGPAPTRDDNHCLPAIELTEFVFVGVG